MSKIAIVDSDFPDQDVERALVEGAGIELAVFEDRSPAGVMRNAADADGIITSYAQVNAQVLARLGVAGGGRLRVVAKTGVGYDNIDAAAASAAGVAVCNVPGYATEVVSDHAIALALCCLRRLNEMDAEMRRGVWDFASHRPLGQVRGRTFGVVGMGDIGRATARKAAGLGFRVVCWSRSLVPGRLTPEGYEVRALNDLLRESDVVSVHVALTPQTRHLIDAERLALMRPGAVLVNTARGAVVDTMALARALREGRLWGAGIDVFEEEPVAPNHPLLSAPHTVLTPHAAYWSEEAALELRRRCAQNCIDAVLGRRPADCVNPEVLG